MDMTELGMLIDVRPVQPANARSPIDSRELGREIDVRLVQLINAYWPISVTELGISQCVRFSSKICLFKFSTFKRSNKAIIGFIIN